MTLPIRLFTLAETRDTLRIGRTKLHELIKSKQLRTVRIGTRKLVRETDLARFLNRCAG